MSRRSRPVRWLCDILPNAQQEQFLRRMTTTSIWRFSVVPGSAWLRSNTCTIGMKTSHTIDWQSHTWGGLPVATLAKIVMGSFWEFTKTLGRAKINNLTIVPVRGNGGWLADDRATYRILARVVRIDTVHLGNSYRDYNLLLLFWTIQTAISFQKT